MLTAAGSSLVSGSSPDSNMDTPAKTVDVKVLRAFLIKSKRQEVGSVIKGMDRRLAVELASANKAELLQPEALAAAAVADLKPAPAPKAPAKKEA